MSDVLAAGLALTFVLENSFKAQSGSRADVPKVAILITDGKSQDDVVPPAQTLRDAGIRVFAVGTSRRRRHGPTALPLRKGALMSFLPLVLASLLPSLLGRREECG